MNTEAGNISQVDPGAISRNPHNPRRYFNDEQLDLLRTSVQEIGILVPLIAYESKEEAGTYVLMDGERRWRSALELGLRTIPVSLIPPPTPLENLLRMFNIHMVHEDWPLISVALALRDVIKESGEEKEKRLSEMTGLTRSSVRRAKRLLSLPEYELELIQKEAHLDRNEQVHREDLYLEIEAAESVLRNEFPEIAETYSREEVIRQFARKREEGSLEAVTDFRGVSDLIKAAQDDRIKRKDIVRTFQRLIDDPRLNPKVAFQAVGASAFEQQTLARRAQLFTAALASLDESEELSAEFIDQLRRLREEINRLLGND